MLLCTYRLIPNNFAYNTPVLSRWLFQRFGHMKLLNSHIMNHAHHVQKLLNVHVQPHELVITISNLIFETWRWIIIIREWKRGNYAKSFSKDRTQRFLMFRKRKSIRTHRNFAANIKIAGHKLHRDYPLWLAW